MYIKKTVIIQPPVIWFFYFCIYLFIYLPIYLVLPFIFIIYSLSGPIFINLIGDTFSVSEWLVLNGGMINEEWIGNSAQGSGCGPIKSSILLFVLWD